MSLETEPARTLVLQERLGEAERKDGEEGWAENSSQKVDLELCGRDYMHMVTNVGCWENVESGMGGVS